jgi:hypothetical protein
MYKSHLHLEDVDDSVVLWKYMNFTKFVALLVNKGIWFNSLGKFEDVFEGTYPSANKKLRPEVYENSIIPQDTYDKIEKLERHSLFVACFHANNYESSAMWSLYSKDEGIAIQTTANHLKTAFVSETRNIYITPVTYIDYENDFLPEGNTMYLATYKRKNFEHENEIRCIYADDLSNPTEKGKPGFYSKMDLKKLVQKVYISPYASPHIENTISDIIRKYDLEVEIISSKLYTLTK